MLLSPPTKLHSHKTIPSFSLISSTTTITKNYSRPTTKNEPRGHRDAPPPRPTATEDTTKNSLHQGRFFHILSLFLKVQIFISFYRSMYYNFVDLSSYDFYLIFSAVVVEGIFCDSRLLTFLFGSVFRKPFPKVFWICTVLFVLQQFVVFKGVDT